MKQTIIIIALSVALAGCSRTVQTTSGQEYLSQYKYVPVAPSIQVKSTDGTIVQEVKSIDQLVREAAAVEPVLKFPARIGLARIDNGSLTTIPAEEAEMWDKTREKLGSSFGQFVPVNPMLARMVADNPISRYGTRTNGVIDVIRLGAAREHLDAVLIYEVFSKENSHSNILQVANASIIGGYILPSKLHNAEGLGNAILIDVVQAYPYGTLTTTVEKTRLSSSWGWGSDYSDREKFAAKVKAQAAKQLSDEAYDLFMELRSQLAERHYKKKP